MNENTINSNDMENLINIPWKDIATNELPVFKSCLCLRNGLLICNLYYNGYNWLDDGYDSKNERIFKDVTHFIELKYFKLPR